MIQRRSRAGLLRLSLLTLLPTLSACGVFDVPASEPEPSAFDRPLGILRDPTWDDAGARRDEAEGEPRSPARGPESRRRPERPSAGRAPAPRERRPRARTRRVDPAPSGYLSGVVVAVTDQTLTLDRPPVLTLAGPRQREELSRGDRVIVRVLRGRVLAIEKLVERQGRARQERPEAPAIGAFVSIDGVQGRVKASRPESVTLRVWDSGRYIGESTLPLRQTTTLKYPRDPEGRTRRRVRPRAPDDPKVAAGLPASGPLSAITVRVDRLPTRDTTLTLTPVAAVEKADGTIAVTLRLSVEGELAFCGGQLNLELLRMKKIYDFAGLRLLREVDSLVPGESRLLNIEGQPLMPGRIRAVRVTLAAPALKSPGDVRR